MVLLWSNDNVVFFIIMVYVWHNCIFLEHCLLHASFFHTTVISKIILQWNSILQRIRREKYCTKMSWHLVACFAHEFCFWSFNHEMYNYKAFIEINQAKHADTKFLFLKRLVFFFSHQVRTLSFTFESSGSVCSYVTWAVGWKEIA
jgi:hypothetical protein